VRVLLLSCMTHYISRLVDGRKGDLGRVGRSQELIPGTVPSTKEGMVAFWIQHLLCVDR
jgi:hypothetical protein